MALLLAVALSFVGSEPITNIPISPVATPPPSFHEGGRPKASTGGGRGGGGRGAQEEKKKRRFGFPKHGRGGGEEAARVAGAAAERLLAETTRGLQSPEHAPSSTSLASSSSSVLATVLAPFLETVIPVAPIHVILSSCTWAAAAIGLQRAGWRWPCAAGALVSLGMQEVVEEMVALVGWLLG